MRYQIRIIQYLSLAASLPIFVASCGSSPTAVKSTPAATTTDTAAGSPSQEDKDRLALYKDVLADLKTTKSPPIDEDYNLVTGSDLEASQNRNAGSATAYESTSSSASTYRSSPPSYRPSYSSSTSDYSSTYSSPKPSTPAWFQQYHSDKAILEAHQYQEALDRGDMRAAREHAQNAQANVQIYREYGGR
jgi:hypothetical protein